MARKSEGILRTSRSVLLNRNVRALAITGIVSGVYLGMFNGILQLFPGALGFGVATLGIMMSIGNRFTGVATSIIQPFAGHYSDVHGRKPVIIAGSIATIASMGLFIGTAVTASWVLMFAAFLLYGASALGNPVTQAVVAESVGLDERKMGVAYSAIFLLGTIPGVVAPYVAGVAVAEYGYPFIFMVAALLESIDLYVYLKELSETKHEERAAQGGRGFSFREALRLPKGSVGYSTALALDAFGFGITTSIIYALIADRFGYSPAEIGLLVGVWSLAIIATQYPATQLLLILGPRRTLALSELLGTLLMVGWLVVNSLPLFLLLSVVFGTSVSTWVPGVSSMLMTHSPSGERGSLGGKVAAIRGLVAFPGPVIGGFLYAGFGYQAPILASVIVTLAATLMILKFVPETSRS
ncbi:MAG TPA: MFS transporter [Nitrososphaerales archaeon]|nr:MFS transporter [Nitrososphaerales archaeon]